MTRTLASHKNDKVFLSSLGIREARRQEILIDNLPCGIKSVSAAWKDRTLWQINAPRALLVCYWKGMVVAFQLEEAALLQAERRD